MYDTLHMSRLLIVVGASHRVLNLGPAPSLGPQIENALAENNIRVMDLEQIYKPDFVKGKVALVTGGDRGLGLAITQELVAQGAEVIIASRQPVDIPGVTQVITGIDVTDNNAGADLVKQLGGKKVDILINNAGYFYGPVEKMDSLNFEEEIKMIDICAVGPLRLTSAMYNAGSLTSGSKVAMITSQGGSISWRTTQNPTGHDYGHHMSKALICPFWAICCRLHLRRYWRTSSRPPPFAKNNMV